MTAIITSIILVAVIGIAILFSYMNRRKKVQQKLSLLNDYANKQGFKISESEIIKNNIIGIGTQTKIVFLMNTKKNTKETIDLQKVQRSGIEEKGRSVNVSGGSQRVVDTMSLTFYMKESEKGKVSFEFYNEQDGDFQLSGEHEFLEKWSAKINALIAGMKS